MTELKNKEKTAQENMRRKRHRMPVYHCKCGAKILITPDLLAMKRAIQNHLIIHKKITGQCLTEEFLTKEIIKILSTFV